MQAATLCQELGSILKGFAEMDDGTCKVIVPRTDIDYSILNISTPAACSFTFQMIPNTHKALILADLSLLEEEVPHVVCELAKERLIVSAIHNHWLFDCPHMIYLHVEAKMRPKEYAQKMACILEQLSLHRYVEQ